MDRGICDFCLYRGFATAGKYVDNSKFEDWDLFYNRKDVDIMFTIMVTLKSNRAKLLPLHFARPFHKRHRVNEKDLLGQP